MSSKEVKKAPIECYVCEKIFGRKAEIRKIPPHKIKVISQLKAENNNISIEELSSCSEEDWICNSCRSSVIRFEKKIETPVIQAEKDIKCYVCESTARSLETRKVEWLKIEEEDIELYSKTRKFYLQRKNKESTPISSINKCEITDIICKVCKMNSEKFYDQIVELQLTEPEFETQVEIANSQEMLPMVDLGVPSTSSSEPFEIKRPTVKRQSFPYARTAITTTSCLFTPQKHTGLIRLSDDARFDAYTRSNGILIPKQTRVCQSNLDEDNYLNQRSINEIRAINYTTEMTVKEFQKFNEYLLQKVKGGIFSNFEDENKIKEKDVKDLTGLTKEQYIMLVNILKPHLKDSPNRSISQALLIYLYKLRRGHTDDSIRIVFNLSTQQFVSNVLTQVRDVLFKHFVPLYLGLKHKSMPELKENFSSKLAEALFKPEENELLLILDGTYIYIEKSSNYWYQRQTYSGHKSKNLLKPMIISTTTGYIVDAYVPVAGKWNDSSIVKDMLSKDYFKEILTETNFKISMVLDRGFRDVIKPLNKRSIKTYMPSLCKKGQKQLTTKEANESRKVTKIRWPIEAINGHLKSKYRALDNFVRNDTALHLEKDMRIALALLNLQYTPLVSDHDNVYIAEAINSKIENPNRLREFLEKNNLINLRKTWTKLSRNMSADFPQLELEDLYALTLGTYQLKQSLSYIAEHLDENSEFSIEICKESFLDREDDFILRSKIQSRHKSSKKYFSFIRYNDKQNGLKSIIGYYCQCKTGSRTVGVCSHTSSVIYYLSYGWRQPIPHPASSLSNILPELTPIVDSSDDSDEEEIEKE